ncbi:segregation and condensation protein A [Galactobacter caseinivorans]|uniref:Segregation and condensation protein A n=1 Tax=Galactobacter caseinivorans TaxID=2676123 RepID=A0A496PKE0_9MICC|nr:ScpA family protein [Galactobacter caseinivorans]RKW70938.1 segregation/condensation protein A [Galactobacter caseinivorans]
MSLPAAPDASSDLPHFQVRLENFSGPFEVLLGLINKRSLDITEVALATVTDEFIAHVRALAGGMGGRILDETTEFLVVASTLLDLKAARLLPHGEVEDEEDIARLEARDLLFARLLQYRAFKEAAGTIAALMETGSAHIPRQVAADDPDVTSHLPELVFTTTPEQLAALAARAMAPREAEPDHVDVTHIHAQPVSVREQAAIVGARLREAGTLSFTQLTEDSEASLVVIARFLALLEMYRDRAVGFEQVAPLAELVVSWLERTEWTPGGSIEEYDGDPEARERQRQEET